MCARCAYDVKKLKLCARLLKEDSTEPETLTAASASEMYDADVLAISESADKIIWSETKDKGGSTRVYLYANGDKETLCSVDGSISDVQYNDDLSLVTIADGTNNILYVSIDARSTAAALFMANTLIVATAM